MDNIEKLKNELETSANKIAEYKQGGFEEQEAMEQANYNRIVNELAKVQETQNKINDLEKQLEQSARRMKEYRDGGFYDQEAAEQADYARIAEEISKLEKTESNSNKTKAEEEKPRTVKELEELYNQRIDKLEKDGYTYTDMYIDEELTELSEELRKAKELEKADKGKKEEKKETSKADEKKPRSSEEIKKLIEERKQRIEEDEYTYTDEYIDEELTALTNELRIAEEREKADMEKTNNPKEQGKKVYDWHPKLTQDQKEELIAEGIEPGDPEYFLSLRNYGIEDDGPFHYEKEDKTKATEPKEQGNKVYDWHPKLTQDQKEELIAEGIMPGDPEYFLSLRNYGIKDDGPFHYEKEDKKEEEKEDFSIKLEPVKKEDKPTPSPKEEDTRKNLPLRSFWEIYDSTCTEHCGSIARSIHWLAKSKINPFAGFKHEDTVQNVLGFALNTLAIPIKLIAKPINAINGTNKKYEEMVKNIQSLTPEELEILTERPEDSIFKSKVDIDYLSPTFMKQNKVNNLYLDAVREVYGKKQRELIENRNIQITALASRIKELSDKGIKNLTEEERQELVVKGKLKQAMESQGDQAAHKYELFEEGAKMKSGSMRNISGWFAGKFNPDNREFNHSMAKLSKERREAIERGDEATATLITNRMDSYAVNQTNIKQIGFNKNNLIDRGDTSIIEGSPCVILDKGPQNKTRLFLSNLAIGATILRTVELIKNNRIIAEQGAEIDRANTANASIPYKDQAKVVDQPTIDGAAKEYSATKIAGAHAEGEYAHLDAGANATDGSWTKGLASTEYRGSDDALHAATTKVGEQVSQATPVEGVRISSAYYDRIATQARPIHQIYAEAHTQFPYDQYMESLQNSIGSGNFVKLLEALGNGTVDVSGSVTGQAVNNLLSGIHNSADYALAALLGGTVMGRQTKDIVDKTVSDISKPTETKKKEKKAEKEEEERE